MIHEVGLSDEFVETPVIFGMPRQGKQHYLDLGKPMRSGISTKVISWPAKVKALTSVRRCLQAPGEPGLRHLRRTRRDRQRNRATTTANGCSTTELAQLSSRRPLVSGTWVHDDHDTSVALLHWTVRNMLVKSVFNLTSGVAGLPCKLATLVDTRLEHTVTNVTDNGSAVDVTLLPHRPPVVSATQTFDTAVIATTAQPALAMYPQMDENHRGPLRDGPLPPARTCLARVSRIGPTIRPRSRLISPYDDPNTIAVIADHNKAPGRAPAGKSLISVLLSPAYLEPHRRQGRRLPARPCARPRQVLLRRVCPARSRSTRSCAGRSRSRCSTRAASSSSPTSARRSTTGLRVQFASDLDRIPGLNGALVSGQEAAARVTARFANRRPAAIR